MDNEERLAEAKAYLEAGVRNSRLSVVIPDVSPIVYITTIVLITLAYTLIFMKVWGVDITTPPNDLKMAMKVAITVWVTVRVTRLILDRVRDAIVEPGIVMGYSNDVFIEGTEGLKYLGRAKEIRVGEITQKEELDYISYWQDLGSVEVDLIEGKTLRYICRGLSGYGGLILTRNTARVKEDVYRIMEEADAMAGEGEPVGVGKKIDKDKKAEEGKTVEAGKQGGK